MSDIDRARELSDAREIERIHGGPEAEPSVWRVDVRFYLRAYDKDDAIKSLTDKGLPFDWESVDSEEWELLD